MTVGLLSFARPPGPTGFSQVNVSGGVGGDLTGGLINAMKTAAGPFFNNGATPSQLDANMLPAAALTSTQYIAYFLSLISSTTGPSTTLVYKWTPGGDAMRWRRLSLFRNSTSTSAKMQRIRTSASCRTTKYRPGFRLSESVSGLRCPAPSIRRHSRPTMAWRHLGNHLTR